MPGGIVPPDGRQPVAPGVGRKARRHDLERPKTPGLSGSSLQYGDVGELRDAQRIAPTGTGVKQVQQPARGTATGAGGTPAASRQAAGMSVPDPIEFLGERGRGTLTDAPSQMSQRPVDVSMWTPIAKRLANSPTASGNLRQAFLHQFAALARRPYVPDVFVADLQEMDRDVENLLNG